MENIKNTDPSALVEYLRKCRLAALRWNAVEGGITQNFSAEAIEHVMRAGQVEELSTLYCARDVQTLLEVLNWPDFASRFEDAHRYTEPVKSRLILFLPKTELRTQAIRVSERRADNGTWYEIQAYNPALSHWSELKTHSNEQDALDDARGWYPEVTRHEMALALGYSSTADMDNAQKERTARQQQHAHAVAYQSTPEAAARATEASAAHGLAAEQIVWVDPAHTAIGEPGM